MRRFLATLSVLVLAACGGGGGGGGGPTSTIQSPSTVTASLSAVANVNGTTDLKWSSSNATKCELTGSTSGSIAISGSKRVTAPVVDSQSYTLTCAGSGTPFTVTETPVLPVTTAENCTPGSAPETHAWLGNVILMNNAWGINSLMKGNTQCVKGSVANGTITADWSWNFENTPGIKSYPSIVHGLIGPGWSSTTKSLPAKISNISNTRGVTYSTTISGTDAISAYNLLIDLYFNRNDAVNNDLELSIGQICVNVCHGSMIDIVTLNNTVYRVYYGTNIDGKSQLSFLSIAVPQYAATVTYKPFMDYAIAHGYMNSTWNLSQVTIGNEVYSGKGNAALTARFID